MSFVANVCARGGCPLLMPGSRIKRDEVDVAPLHQMSSRPAGALACHARSSRGRRAERLHCASNSSSE
jgi:hypothetical protein